MLLALTRIDLKKLASNADIKIDVIMSILSNYVPMCIVESSVSCSIDEIGVEFANKFINITDERLIKMREFLSEIDNNNLDFMNKYLSF